MSQLLLFLPGDGISGSFAATESGSDTLAASGSVLVAGSLAATETGADSFVSTGSVLVSGSLAATESGADTFAATGTVGAAAATGDLAATEIGSDTFTSSGTVLVSGALAAAETGADAFAATGTVANASPTGDMAAQEAGDDTFAATGDVSGTGTETPTTGGWGNFMLAYDREVLRKRKAAAQALEDEIAAEDAAAVEQLAPETTEQTESGIALEALRQMVATAEANAAAMLESERVSRAFARAQAQMTAGALLALDRELTRLRDEEEFAVLMALAMDD